MDDFIVTEVQNVAAKVTHQAIASKAAEYKVDYNSFWVNMNQSVESFDSGGLLMVPALCADAASDLDILEFVIESNNAEISDDIQQNLTTIFLNDLESGGVIAKLSLTDWSNQSIYIIIRRFDGFTASDIVRDSNLQKVFANLTHHAIADNGVDTGSFWMDFQQASDRSDGLYITQIAYAFNHSLIDDLNSAITTKYDEINDYIKQKMTVLFLDGNDTEGMTVSISLLSGFLLKGF